MVRARSAAGQHRGLGRLNAHAEDVWQSAVQLSTDAQETAGGADVRTEGIDPAVELLEDLPTEPAIPVDHVRVVELIRGIPADLRHDLCSAPHHARHELGSDALW